MVNLDKASVIIYFEGSPLEESKIIPGDERRMLSNSKINANYLDFWFGLFFLPQYIRLMQVLFHTQFACIARFPLQHHEGLFVKVINIY